MSMCITVAAIEMKPKRCIIITTEGRRLGCYADKIAKFGFETGAAYNVETTEVQYGDSLLTNITGAKRVTVVAGQPAAQSAPPLAAPFRTPEQMTVTEITCAYVAAGKCTNPAELRQTMQAILNAFRATWPETDYAQAAE